MHAGIEPDEGNEGHLIDLNRNRFQLRRRINRQKIEIAVRSTSRSAGGLIIRANDDLHLWYHLVTAASLPITLMRGVIRGADAKRDEWRVNNSAWCVPQPALTSLDDVVMDKPVATDGPVVVFTADDMKLAERRARAAVEQGRPAPGGEFRRV